MAIGVTEREARTPGRVRFTYGFASVAGNAVSQTWSLWLVYFYAPPSDATIATRVSDAWGIDARVLLGLTLTVARLIEAFDDPLIGYWTDRTKSRWGRRLPFIVIFTPFWAFLFVFFFLPPVGHASLGNLTYLFFLAMAFYMLSNLSGAAQEALLPTIARRADDRLSVATWQLVFGVVGAIVGLSVSSLVVQQFGFTAMAITVACIAFGVRYGAMVVIWPYARADDTPSTPGFRRAVRDTFSNPQFIAYLPSFVLFQTGLQMLTAVLPFYVDTVLSDSTLFGMKGSENTGAFTFMLTAAVITGILAAIPVYRRLAGRFGKARAYRVAMLWSAAAFPLLFFAGFVPALPALGQAIGAILLCGMATAGVFLFPNILTADIVDYDAERTNTRREAMFYGTQNMVEKAATALSPLIFAAILLAGDTSANPLGIRLVGPVAGVLVFIAFLSFRRYSLAPDLPAPSVP
ncbi:MAG: MFS transporter [Dehalococcoidia bacterium]|nr:MFS transporter [Dehalococcoidia bacterium]